MSRKKVYKKVLLTALPQESITGDYVADQRFVQGGVVSVTAQQKNLCGHRMIVFTVYRNEVPIYAHFVWRHSFMSFWPALEQSEAEHKSTYIPGSGIWTREQMCPEFAYCDVTKKAEAAINRMVEGYSYWAKVNPGIRQICEMEYEIESKQREKETERRHRTLNAKIYVPPMPHNLYFWACKIFQSTKGKQHKFLLIQRIPIEKDPRQPEYSLPGQSSYVFRYFSLRGKRNPELTETYRAYKYELWERFHFGAYGEEIGAYGSRQTFTDVTTFHMADRNAYAYMQNLESQGIPKSIRSCVEAANGTCDPDLLIRAIACVPDIETIVKAGGTRLVKELTENFRYSDKINILPMKEIPRQTLKRVIEHNGGMTLIKVLKRHPKTTDENCDLIAQIGSLMKEQLVREISERVPNMNHVITLLKKDGNIKMEDMQEYLDYLVMANERGMDVADEIVYRNKKWRTYHNRYVEEKIKNQEEWKVKRYEKKYPEIQKDKERNDRILAWQQDGYIIKPAHNCKEIVMEGKLQHHCVGSSDRYFERMAKRESYICFLRREEEPEVPWYTIETDGKKILQFYAAYDRQPDQKMVEGILKKWLKEIRKRQGA